MSNSSHGVFARTAGKAAQAPTSAVDAWQPTRAFAPDATPLAAAEWDPGSPPVEPEARSGPPDAWQSTRAQTALATQFLKDEDDYLVADKADIGRQTGTDEHELFVSCDPAQAMQQQFEHLRPEFIAIHDIATASSRKLLVGIAAASGRAVQKLVIRRQGYGTALATLEFIELPTPDNRPLRLYTTDADADAAARHGLARMLLAFSRLGAVIVGDLPAHAIEAALKPLHDDIAAGPWSNRHLLLLPLGSASALVTHGMSLGRSIGVTVRTTPQVARPADAWSFITGTWNRLREQTDPDGRTVPELGGFSPALGAAVANARRSATLGMPETGPGGAERPAALSMRPMPPISAARPAIAASVLDRYVRQVGDLTGVIGCCVFEVETGRTLAHAGAADPGAAELGTRGMELLAGLTAGASRLGLGDAAPEAAITLAAHHLVLRPLPRHAGIALHALLDKSSANLMLVRLQILRMDPLFDSAEKA